MPSSTATATTTPSGWRPTGPRCWAARRRTHARWATSRTWSGCTPATDRTTTWTGARWTASQARSWTRAFRRSTTGRWSTGSATRTSTSTTTFRRRTRCRAGCRCRSSASSDASPDGNRAASELVSLVLDRQREELGHALAAGVVVVGAVRRAARAGPRLGVGEVWPVGQVPRLPDGRQLVGERLVAQHPVDGDLALEPVDPLVLGRE